MSNSYIFVVLLILECLWLTSADPLSRQKRAKTPSAADIKKQITQANAWEVLGLGGRYGAMQDSVSKKEIIESDHFPPKAIYASAKDKHIKDIAERQMAAVSLRYAHHREFITTGYSPEAQATLKKLFQQGKYFEAIDLNIGWYQKNPDRADNARSSFDYLIKQGVMDALHVHVKNGLINQTQMDQLVKNHSLDVNKFPTLANIVHSHLRDEAREYLLERI